MKDHVRWQGGMDTFIMDLEKLEKAIPLKRLNKFLGFSREHNVRCCGNEVE